MNNEFSNNFTRIRFSKDGEQWIKLDMLDANGTRQKFRKKVSELTQSEIDLELLYVQRDKESDIDSGTRKIFSEGVAYADEIFSLSNVAWVNWLDMRYRKDNILITYPYNISCIHGSYSIADPTECQAIIDLIFSTKENILEGGRALVSQVYAANTIAEVEAITDNR